MKSLSAGELRRIRRSRRRPRITQFDYLHVRRLVDDLGAALARLAQPNDRILDVWSGSRPYDDLLPPSAEVVALDVEGNPYGVADVISNDFLPFDDASFDGAFFTQAFDLVPDPAEAVAELERVVRPGGWIVITVPFVWEFERSGSDRRYTATQLAALFSSWDEVSVVEDGGRAVVWATVTGSLAHALERRLSRGLLTPIARPAFACLYGAVNLAALALDAAERKLGETTHVLPMNLLLTARRRGVSTRRDP